MELTVTVKQIGNKTTNGNYIHKLVAEKKEEFLGMIKIAKQTYYVAMQGQATIGSTHILDLNKFQVTERPFTITKNDGTQEEIKLKWLHLK